MKRLLLLLMLIPLTLGAQGIQKAQNRQITTLVKFMVLGTGATTGTYYPLGRAFANLWTEKIDGLDVMWHSTRGSVDNIKLLKSRELNLAIAQGDIVLSALNGTGNFKNAPVKNLKILMSLYPEVVQVVVHADSEILSIDDLKGKKVVVGAQGSGNVLTSVEILAARGIEISDFEPVYISYDESIQAMERRDCDAAFIIAGIPTRAISEMGTRFNIRVLGFSDSERVQLAQQLPYLASVSIGNNTYNNQNERIKTVALMAMLVTDDRMSENMAYRLCDVIFSNPGFLSRIHQRAADISLETFFAGAPFEFLHPGSKKFLEQKQ